MATTADSGSGEVLRSERIAGGILPRVLNSFDMIAIFVAIVLFISNAGVIPGAGASAFIYWILGFLAFLIPGAIVTGQLGLMFPGEGSIYVWTNKAFGAFLGFFAGFCARSEEHTSELQSLAYLVCRLLLEKKKKYFMKALIMPIHES